MNGPHSRSGFRFQDHYLLLRAFHVMADAYPKAWDSIEDLLPVIRLLPHRFGVEVSSAATPTAAGGPPEWDVLIAEGLDSELVEVKSGEVSRSDRIAFWLRLRAEVSKRSGGGVGINPGFVLDPDFASAEPWLGLAAAAQALPSGAALPSGPGSSVSNSADLLHEALWWLCCAADCDGKPLRAAAIPASAAVELLARFRFHPIRKETLEQQVEDAIKVLFPDGWQDTIRRDLRAWIDERSDPRNPESAFSIGEFFAKAHLLERALAAPPGEIARWRALWDRLPQPGARVRSRIGEAGEELNISDVQPAAAKKLVSLVEGGALGLGHAGLGKSVLSAQIHHAYETSGAKAFWCAALDVSTEEIADIEKSLALWAGIGLLRQEAKPVWFILDGLDEVSGKHRETWTRAVVRLGKVAGLRLLVMMREADWRDDGETRRALGHWPQLRLAEWPEEVVRRLLALQPTGAAISGNLLTLLRTPILLDLFWRTFVESSPAAAASPATLQTRHGLVLVFWQERLLDGSRRSHISRTRRADCLRAVSELGAALIGPFSATGLNDPEGLSVLVAEGFLIEHRGPQPKFDFRHPLLRDFALAQWCIEENDARKTVEQWLSIQGAPQRHGCLRAILEALSDPAGGSSLSVADVVAELIRVSPDGVRMLARVLGRLAPTNALDPASWPAAVRDQLPGWFASDLVYSAQRQNVPAWAERVGLYWPDHASWFDERLSERLCDFCEVIHEQAKRKTNTAPLGVLEIVRKLRNWSENPVHQAGFAGRNAWVLRRTVTLVAALDPSADTVSWLERLVDKSDRGLHSAIVEGTLALARHDPLRAANLLRRAIGLGRGDGTPQVVGQALNIVVDHDVVRTLVGHEHAPASGLLCAHPSAFFPLGVELVEGLWPFQVREAEKRREEIRQTLTPEEQAAYDEINPLPEPENPATSAGQPSFIDDHPNRNFWFGTRQSRVRDHLLHGIEDAIRHLADQSPSAFASECALLLRVSRSATIQSLLLDAAVKRAAQPPFAKLLAEMLADQRLFQVPDLLHWLCAALRIVWPNAGRDLRAQILDNAEAIHPVPGAEKAIVIAALLVAVPENELPERLRALVADVRARGDLVTVLHPREMFTYYEGRSSDGEETEVWVGTWPASFDTQLLSKFRRAIRQLGDISDAANQIKPADLLAVIDLAKQVIALALADPTAIQHADGNQWVLEDTRRVLALLRTYKNFPELQARIPDLAKKCAALCFPMVEAPPLTASGDPVLQHEVFTPPQPWFAALELLDLALRCEPLWTDEGEQQRFERFISETWKATGPVIHQFLAVKISPRHWSRDETRRALFSNLVFGRATHPQVLSAAFQTLQNFPPAAIEWHYRDLLTRSGLATVPEVVETFGHFLGFQGIVLTAAEMRTPLSALAGEVITNPAQFPLLVDAGARRRFVREFLIGMKEAVKRGNLKPSVANDYGDWSLRGWRHLCALPGGSEDERSIILHLIHWFGKGDRNKEWPMEWVRHWWQQVIPLCHDVAASGDPHGTFNLFFQFHGGEFHDVAEPRTILDFAESFVTRLEKELSAGAVSLDETSGPNGEWQHHSWREIAGYVAEAIDGFHRSFGAQEHNRAYGLLDRLARDPIRSPKAHAALLRLQDEESSG